MTTAKWIQANDGTVLVFAPVEDGSPAAGPIGTALRALNMWDEVQTQIRSNPGLSEIGRLQELEKAGAEPLALIASARSGQESLRVNAETLKLRLLQPLGPQNPMEQGDFKEQRALLSEIPQEDRGRKVMEQIAALNITFCRAVFATPPAFPLIADYLKERLAELLLAQADPRLHAKWKALTDAAGQVEHAIDTAEKRIRGGMTLSNEGARRQDVDRLRPVLA